MSGRRWLELGAMVVGLWAFVLVLGHDAGAGDQAAVTLTATIPAQETVGDCTCTCDGFSVRLAVEESQEPAP